MSDDDFIATIREACSQAMFSTTDLYVRDSIYLVNKDSNNNIGRENLDLENRAEIDRILERIQHEEYMIQRMQERIHGDFNERRLAVLRNQLEVLQESLRRLQQDFDDMH